MYGWGQSFRRVYPKPFGGRVTTRSGVDRIVGKKIYTQPLRVDEVDVPFNMNGILIFIVHIIS